MNRIFMRGWCLRSGTIIVRTTQLFRNQQSQGPNRPLVFTRLYYYTSSNNTNANNSYDNRTRPHLSLSQTRALSTMATASPMNQLLLKLDHLTLDSIAEKYPATYPEINPLDLYRVHISEVLAPITGVAAEKIHPVIQWTNALDKGDFTLPIPALRIKGAKPDALGAEWVAKVRISPSLPLSLSLP